jgi:plasmid stabilization system protein ParE
MNRVGILTPLGMPRMRDWYAERSPLAARGFLLELSDAVDAAIANPRGYPLGRGTTHRYVFPGKYPFTLVYRIVGDEIEIVAVAHHKRHPSYWLSRT